MSVNDNTLTVFCTPLNLLMQATLALCQFAGWAVNQMCEIQLQRNKSLFSIICCNLLNLVGFGQFSTEGMV